MSEVKSLKDEALDFADQYNPAPDVFNKQNFKDAQRVWQQAGGKDYQRAAAPVASALGRAALSQLPAYVGYATPAARALGPFGVGLGLGMGAYSAGREAFTNPDSPINTAGRADRAQMKQDWNAGNYGSAAMDAVRAMAHTAPPVIGEMLAPSALGRLTRSFGFGGQ